MNEKRVISLCQLAMKAGRCAYGSRLLDSIRSRQAKLVLYASSTGENQKKKILNKCASFHVPCEECPRHLLDAVSYRPISALALTDEGFAKAVEEEVKGQVIACQQTTEKKE